MPTTTTGRNRWTFEQRLCLDVLWTPSSLKISAADRVLVFNTIFQEHLVACGIPEGLSYNAISAQYAERKYTHRSSWNASWERICAMPKVDLALREQLQRKINNILQHADADTLQAGAGAVVSPPSTPRRTDRARKLTENPYDLATPGPVTPVWKHVHLQYVQAPPSENPYATPAMSSRKRPADRVYHWDVEEDDDTDNEYVPKAKKVRRSSPVVVVPPSPPEARALMLKPTPKTTKSPKSRYRSGAREGANIPYDRFNSTPIMLTENEFKQTQEPLKRISEAVAHPKTTPALLFRYWDEKSHGINSANGFVCGLFKRAIIEPGPPPSCDALEWNYVASHLNNGGLEKNGTPSPFISTSNLLIWVIRIALKRSCETSRISVIDTSKLDPNSIFWVPPFYEALKKKRPFTKGGFNYRGSHEHLVWDRINSSAIVKTFSLQELINFAKSNNAVRTILRLEAVPSHTTKELKRDNIMVNGPVAEAVAQVVMFLGLDHRSSWETLSQAVSEVVQGWALKADGTSQDKAGIFVQAFWRKSGAYIDIADQLKLQHAFHNGLRWSCGNLNARLKGPAGYEEAKSHAAKRGLKEPSKAVADKLNRAMFQVILREKTEERMHLSPSEAQEEHGEDVINGQVGQLMSGMSRLLTAGENIVYE